MDFRMVLGTTEEARARCSECSLESKFLNSYCTAVLVAANTWHPSTTTEAPIGCTQLGDRMLPQARLSQHAEGDQPNRAKTG